MACVNNMNDKIEAVINIILTDWLLTVDRLLGLEGFSKLSSEVFFGFATEFILFDLHLCDIQIFALKGAKERDIILDGVTGRLFTIIKSTDDEKLLSKTIAQVPLHNFDKYYEYFLKAASIENFIRRYNEREYGAYKVIYAVDENPKGTLMWEFSKKMATLVSGSADITIVYTIYQFSMLSLTFYSLFLKSTFGFMSVQDAENDFRDYLRVATVSQNELIYIADLYLKLLKTVN